MIARSPAARLAVLVAAAVALVAMGVVIERAGLFPRLRFAVQRADAELPSTLVVDRADAVQGLPILSVYLDPADLAELLANKHQHGRDWERRGTISYFDDGELRFAGAAGVRVHGGGSRLNSPHQSFRLFFRRRYGFTRMGNGVLFGGASQPLQRLVVHNDVRRDTDGTLWRLVNPLAYDLARQIGGITPETEPARFFLNGEELGLYVLTEHFDDEYFESHMPGRRITMRAADMEALHEQLESMRPLTMDNVRGVIDLENMVNWFLSVVYAGTRDAYQGPGQFLDESTGRWFWVNWDMDQSFRNWDLDSFQYLLPFPAERGRGRRRSEPRPAVMGTLISDDAEFREYFASRIDQMLNHQLTPAFLRERRVHYYETALRFGVTDLRYERRVREFLERRSAFVRAVAEQWLNTRPGVKVSVRRADGGALLVDGYHKDGGFEGTYFPGREVAVATPDRSSATWVVNGAERGEGAEIRVTADEALDIVAVPPGAAFAGEPSGPDTSSAPAPAPAPAPPVRWIAVESGPGGASFQISRTEITVAQYRVFAAATGRMLPRQPLWNADDHPVVNLTWVEANAYCAWTGGRLPAEAEWEFAARAGSTTRYPWGDAFDPSRVNGTRQQGRDRFAETAPVASFEANAFGIHDMIGNVWEFTSSGHPAGKAIRGGAWINRPDNLRVNRRIGVSATGRHNLYVGIRCVR